VGPGLILGLASNMKKGTKGNGSISAAEHKRKKGPKKKQKRIGKTCEKRLPYLKQKD